MPADRPESPQSGSQAESVLGRTRLDRPAETCPQVSVLASEPLERLHLLRPPQLRFGPLGHMQVVREVTVARVVGALAALQLLQCKVTDRGQHRVAGFA